jgi:hypothetical protein
MMLYLDMADLCDLTVLILFQSGQWTVFAPLYHTEASGVIHHMGMQSTFTSSNFILALYKARIVQQLDYNLRNHNLIVLVEDDIWEVTDTNILEIIIRGSNF